METAQFSHLNYMNRMKYLLAVLTFFLIDTISAQDIKGRIWGEYTVFRTDPPIQHIDSIDFQPKMGILPIETIEFYGAHKLKLKWNGRFTITNEIANKQLTWHTDNPTIHGSYKLKNDTLMLKYTYMVQHFNDLAPKSRVKSKLTHMKRFLRIENGLFIIQKNSFWKHT